MLVSPTATGTLQQNVGCRNEGVAFYATFPRSERPRLFPTFYSTTISKIPAHWSCGPAFPIPPARRSGHFSPHICDPNEVVQAVMESTEFIDVILDQANSPLHED